MKTSLLALAILSAMTAAAQAAPNDGIVGPYARVEVGRSNFGLSNAAPRLDSEDHGQAVKIFGGYRSKAGFGIEMGYAALGSFSEDILVGSTRIQQDGKGRSVFGVATGRWPVGESFALHGRLGVSSGRVSGTPLLSPSDSLIGHKTSVMVGIGAEYRPRPNIALTLNYDHYGQLSDKVEASALLFGLHFTL